MSRGRGCGLSTSSARSAGSAWCATQPPRRRERGPRRRRPPQPFANVPALLYARVMPANQFFSHVTAAVLWELPLPSRVLTDAFGRPRMLDVAVRAPLRHPRHDGVLGHQVKQRSVAVVDHATHGVPLTSPAFTWVMLAAVVRDEYDLVALADGVVREQMFTGDAQPLGTLSELESAVRSGRRVGIRALREALPRVRTRSASRTETRCRLIIVDAGLPEPLLNHAVFDSIGGLIGVVDLAYPELRIAIEYEGEHHLRDPEQWAKDIARYEALAGAGWFVIRVTKNDVFDGRAGLVRRVRSAIRSRRRRRPPLPPLRSHFGSIAAPSGDRK